MASSLTVVKGDYCTRLTPDGIISWPEVHYLLKCSVRNSLRGKQVIELALRVYNLFPQLNRFLAHSIVHRLSFGALVWGELEFIG